SGDGTLGQRVGGPLGGRGFVVGRSRFRGENQGAEAGHSREEQQRRQSRVRQARGRDDGRRQLGDRRRGHRRRGRFRRAPPRPRQRRGGTDQRGAEAGRQRQAAPGEAVVQEQAAAVHAAAAP